MNRAHALARAALVALLAVPACSASETVGDYLDDGTDDAALNDEKSAIDQVATMRDGRALDALVSETPFDAPFDAPASVTSPQSPPTLSASGLFTGIDSNGALKLATGVQPFQPRYALWSDGAAKTRWVYLPPGKKIDTTDPDHWSFPVGTKFWKEFAVGGKRVETRFIERFGPGADDYLYAAYWWKVNDGGSPTDAVLADTDVGVPSASGTNHDIPSQEDCKSCHGPLQEHVLGFSALELNHLMPGVTIATLMQGGWLSQPPPSNLEFPGSDMRTRDALGYLHANCGNCHNLTPGVFMIPEPRMDLRVRIGQRLEQTGAYETALNVEVTKFYHPQVPTITYRIAGGDPSHSGISFRMADLAKDNRMPPVGTKLADSQGLATVNAWIATLPPTNR